MAQQISHRPSLISAIVFLLLANGVFLCLRWVHPYPPTITIFESKALEILSLHLPTSNFYPIGPGLLYAPFVALSLAPEWTILVYYNIGLIFFWLVCQRIDSRFWRWGALLGLCGNDMLLTIIQWGEDTVLQFTCLSAALYFMVARRAFLFAALALLAALVRATDFAPLLFFSIIMTISSRAKIWLIFPLLYGFVLLFNMVEYGSPAPGLNSGYNIFKGQHEFYVLGHPKFDIDQFLEKHGFMDVGNVLPNNVAHTEVEIDRAYRNAGLRSAMASPSRFLFASAFKTISWLFNVEMIPEIPGKYSLERDSTGQYKINVDESPGASAYILRTVYIFYKVIYNGLFMAAILNFIVGWRGWRRLDPISLLLFTTLLTLPIAILTFPNTRFKIIYEILALPAIALHAQALARTIMAGIKVETTHCPPVKAKAIE